MVSEFYNVDKYIFFVVVKFMRFNECYLVKLIVFFLRCESIR